MYVYVFSVHTWTKTFKDKWKLLESYEQNYLDLAEGGGKTPSIPRSVCRSSCRVARLRYGDYLDLAITWNERLPGRLPGLPCRLPGLSSCRFSSSRLMYFLCRREHEQKHLRLNKKRFLKTKLPGFSRRRRKSSEYSTLSFPFFMSSFCSKMTIRKLLSLLLSITYLLTIIYLFYIFLKEIINKYNTVIKYQLRW